MPQLMCFDLSHRDTLLQTTAGCAAYTTDRFAVQAAVALHEVNGLSRDRRIPGTACLENEIEATSGLSLRLAVPAVSLLQT